MGSGRLTSYTQLAEDISNVLEVIAGNELRVVPVLGVSAGQNVLDVLQLKGIDMAFADQDVLEYVRKKDPVLYGDIHKRINYIAKIFNPELHVYAKKDIDSLEDLAGKKISCLKEGSTAAAACHNLFSMLKINAEIVYNSGEVAYQKILKGEISAAVDGAAAFAKMRAEDGIRFVPISEESLPRSDFNLVRATYVPARLTHKDHPHLIPEGETVLTIAQSSMLVVYAWPPGTQRYEMLQKFIRLFFDNIDEFRKAPRHPKWADINLATDVPGWTRFPAAQQWVDAKRRETPLQTDRRSDDDPKMKAAFSRFLEDYARKTGDRAQLVQSDALYSQFVQWWRAKQAQ
jgi:TRAP-type uncharacterized transport system substrate-binding protein